MLGNVVNNLVNTNQSSGYKSIQWDATNNQGQPVSAGVYLYSLEAGNLYSIGDSVAVLGTDELGRITKLGSNYVIIESGGKLYRKWINDIELFEKNKTNEDAVQVTKNKIDREKAADKIKHNRILDRAKVRKIKNLRRATNA